MKLQFKMLIWVIFGLLMSLVFYISYVVRGELMFIFNHVYKTFLQALSVFGGLSDSAYIVSGLLFYFLLGLFGGVLVTVFSKNKETLNELIYLTPQALFVMFSILFFMMIFSGEQLASLIAFVLSLMFSIPSIFFLIMKIKWIRSRDNLVTTPLG